MGHGGARTRLADRLRGTRFTAVRWVGEIDSTHRALLDEARSGAQGPEVLVADHQTAGRGRRDRTWVAPPGAGLLVSVLVTPPIEPANRPLVTAAAALATADAVTALTGVEVGIKWPNDLVVDGRKLGGVLAEAVGPTIVVGVGTNVNWPDELPTDIASTAVAINHLTEPPPREALLVAYLQHLERRLASLEVGTSDVVHDFRRRCVTLGREVRVETDAGTFEAQAVDVGAHGSLIVEADGGRREVHAGDVIHLR